MFALRLSRAFLLAATLHATAALPLSERSGETRGIQIPLIEEGNGNDVDGNPREFVEIPKDFPGPEFKGPSDFKKEGNQMNIENIGDRFIPNEESNPPSNRGFDIPNRTKEPFLNNESEPRFEMSNSVSDNGPILDRDGLKSGPRDSPNNDLDISNRELENFDRPKNNLVEKPKIDFDRPTIGFENEAKPDSDKPKVASYDEPKSNIDNQRIGFESGPKPDFERFKIDSNDVPKRDFDGLKIDSIDRTKPHFDRPLFGDNEEPMLSHRHLLFNHKNTSKHLEKPVADLNNEKKIDLFSLLFGGNKGVKQNTHTQTGEKKSSPHLYVNPEPRKRTGFGSYQDEVVNTTVRHNGSLSDNENKLEDKPTKTLEKKVNHFVVLSNDDTEKIKKLTKEIKSDENIGKPGTVDGEANIDETENINSLLKDDTDNSNNEETQVPNREDEEEGKIDNPEIQETPKESREEEEASQTEKPHGKHHHHHHHRGKHHHGKLHHRKHHHNKNHYD